MQTQSPQNRGEACSLTQAFQRGRLSDCVKTNTILKQAALAMALCLFKQ